MRFIFRAWPRALVLLTLLPRALGDAVNRTIDDSLGDSVTQQIPTYFPEHGVWEDQTCSGCAIQPDRSLAFGGTWTAATYHADIGNVSISFNFHGTAVYIFFILANDQGPGITTLTECNFTLDGVVVGHFVHQPTTSLDLEYNATVFSQTGLPNKDHAFQISTTGVEDSVFVNFDYAIYTFENDSTLSTSTSASSENSGTSDPSPLASSSASSKQTTSTGAIVGGVVSGIVLSAMLVALLFWRRRQRSQKPNSNTTMVENLDGSAPGHSYVPDITVPDFVPNQTSSQQYPTSISSYLTSLYTRSRYAPTSMRVSSDFDNNENSNRQSQDYSSAYPTSYASSDLYSTLPSGQVVLGTIHQRQIGSVRSSITLPTTMTTMSTVSDMKTLLPLPLPTLPSSDSRAELRRMRQQELARQMEAIQREMKSLQHEAAGRHASVKRVATRRDHRGNEDDSDLGDEDEDVSKLKEQIRMMHQQITSLQGQLRSPWAQGLSNEPPPGYSPR
ncbi:hypothetical protein K435DRAFT_714971 [Dendrothele bispora CBS 962.96]|uniref:Uncharacterized protein n=1 Tax=Dendrothele bispora (strain CBS 962.96) TaxID=1314807 RepID=A0A4S8MM79_DENBC|nr:hypothetical protein K435DRAFT_714971 [Dendrothele bispora CBS 962.96]